MHISIEKFKPGQLAYLRYKKQGLGLLAFIIAMLFSFSAMSTQHYFTNISGYTLNSKGELVSFSELYVVNDKVQAIGKKLDVPFDLSPIDMKQAVMLPGIIDAHGHVLGLGDNLIQVDLRGTINEQDAVKRIKAHVGQASTQENAWIIGRGWNQVLWSNQQFPSKNSLDEAFENTPVFLSRVDGHAAWVNSKALALAGINTNTLSPAGGEIVKGADTQPTGLLIDNAMDLVTAVMPPPTQHDLLTRLNLASEHLLSLGITSVHDAGISQEVKALYKQQAQASALKVRIYAMLAATDPNIKEMLAEGHYADQQDFLSIRSVKAYGDGALGSRGAALLKPYSDDPHNSGLLVTPQEDLPALFNTVIGANFQLNFHAIGDRANRLALTQFASTFESNKNNTQRHRIEHAQIIAPQDIPLFKQYSIIPSMQPTHATSDMNMAQDRLGEARLSGAYAWQTFLKQGSKIAFGSDFPVELANPFHGLHAAVTRQDASQNPKDGWIAKESVTVEQAFRGFTLDAAYAAFQDKIIGSLEVGKKADFIVIDRNIFTIDAPLIRDTKVMQTWINGERVY